MSNPIAVIISDVHYNMNTLQVADAAVNMAIDSANDLEIPLIVAGDLHDTKANLRGECIEAMIKTFRRCKIPAIVLVGNHDLINERSKSHSLEFLRPHANLVDAPIKNLIPYWTFIPYQSDIEELKNFLKILKPGSKIILHQGIKGSNAGDYIQDKSAIDQQDVAGFRVISGHYHTRQTIQLPDGGKWDYLGNPFTLTYGEANDPPKGYHILMDDGSLEFVPTNLREHKILDYTVGQLKGEAIFLGEDQDLVWVKIRGTREELQNITKHQVAMDLDIAQSFRLDIIPDDAVTEVESTKEDAPQDQVLDSLIDSLTNTSDECKLRLKDLWKDLLTKD